MAQDLGGINALAFSLDGQALLAGSARGKIAVWNLANGQIVGTYTEHEPSPVLALAVVTVLPDGPTLVASGVGNKVRIWNPGTFQTIGTFDDLPAEVASIAFHWSGRLLGVVSKNRQAQLWESRDWANRSKTRAKFDTPLEPYTAGTFQQVPPLALLQGERPMLVAVAQAGGPVQVCELENFSDAARQRLIEPPPRQGVSQLTLGGSKSHPILALAGEDGTVEVWNLEDKQLLVSVTSPGGFALSPDGHTLAWFEDGGASRSLVLTAVAKRERMARFPLDGRGKLALTEDQPRSTQALNHVHGVAFSPEGEWLAAVSSTLVKQLRGGEVNLHGGATRDTPEKDPLNWEGEMGLVWDLAFHPKGTDLAVARNDGGVYLVRRPTSGPNPGWKSELLYRHGQLRVNAVAFSPGTGDIVASAGWDGKVRVWDVRTQTERRVFVHEKEKVHTVCFSPDARRLASAGEDGIVYVWALEGNTAHGRWRHGAEVKKIAFSPDGQWLASAGLDGKVHLFDTAGNRVYSLGDHPHGAYGVAFS